MTISTSQKNVTDLLLVDLIDEITRNLQAGQPVDLQAYASEYPDHAEELQKLLPALELLAILPQAGSPSGASGSRPADRPTVDAASGPVPGTLGDFRILRQIGKGGMGVVYEAEQISLGRRVALKVLPLAAMLDPRHLQRFQNEARAAASLKHANIVQVFSVGCERGVHYYAMEYVEGQTLADVIAALRPKADGGRRKGEGGRGKGEGGRERVEGGMLSQRLALGEHGATGQGSGARDQGPGEGRVAGAKPDPREALVGEPPDAQAPASCGVAPLHHSHPSADTQPVALLCTEGSTRGPEFFRTVARLGIQAAEALEHAHQMGVVHRDIKPSNLMVESTLPSPAGGRGAGGEGAGGEAPRLWITDFGLARIQTPSPFGGEGRSEGASLTMSGDLLGTLRYMSPEQLRAEHGVLDHRTDVYSLGLTLYELLTLRPAFSGDDRQKLIRQITEDDPPPPRQLNQSIPKDLETIILKATAKEPEARYATAQELANDLRRFLEDKPVHARRPSLAARAAKWSRRHRSLVWTAAAVLLLGVMVAAGLAWSAYRRHLVLERAVEGHLAAAGAFLRSEDHVQASQEVVAAEARLDEAKYRAGPLAAAVAATSAEVDAQRRAEERFEQFQELRHRVHADMYYVDDATRSRARENCRAALKLYEVMESGVWKEHSAYQDLSARHRKALEEDIVELLFVLARLQVRENVLHPVPRSASYRFRRYYWVIPQKATLDPAEREAAHRRAIQALLRIETFHRPIPGAYLWMAELWRALGKEDLAKKADEQAKAPSPATGLEYFVLGEFYAHQGRLAQALEAYSLALRYKPDHDLSLLASGVILTKLGKYEAAEMALTGAIAINPRTTLAYIQRGNTCLNQGKSKLAEVDFNGALKLDARLAEAYFQRGVEYWNGSDWDQAITELTQAIRLDPRCAKAYEKRGDAYQRKLDFDNAIADYAEAIRLDPKCPSAYTGRGRAYAEKGDLDRAIADCNEAIRLGPDRAGAYSSRGTFYADKGQLDQAIADYSQAIRLDPDRDIYHSNRGLKYMVMGESDKAIADFTETIRLSPNWRCPYVYRGMTYLGCKGDFDKALADLTAAIQIDQNWMPYLYRAHAYASKGEPERAIADYVAAAWNKPYWAKPFVDRGFVDLTAGHADQAITDFLEAIRIDPDSADAFWGRGNAYAEKGNLDQALGDYREAIRLRPYWVQAYNNRGVVYLRKGDLDGALRDYAEAIRLDPKYQPARENRQRAETGAAELDKAVPNYYEVFRLRPDDARTYFDRAEMHAREEEWQEAILDYTEAIRLRPQSAMAYNNRGWVHASLSDTDRAISDWTEAIRLDPKAGVYINRGSVYADAKKDLEKAIADFTEALRLDPESALAYTRRGAAYAQKGKLDQAIADYNQAIRLDPQCIHAYCHRALARIELGQIDTTLKEIGESSESNSSNPLVLDRLAWLLVTCPDTRLRKAEGATELALQLAHRAVRLSREDGRLWNTLGVAQYRSGEWKAADQALWKAADLDRYRDPSNWFFQAMNQWQMGPRDAAYGTYDKGCIGLERKDPEDQELRRFQAEAAELLGVAEGQAKEEAK
jgi:tetratricopeptide (TPR) repeat protein